MFADIVNFTEWYRILHQNVTLLRASAIAPSKVAHYLNSIYSAMDNLVKAAGVEKVKTIGGLNALKII